jgi:DNA polymerase (family X)
VKVFGKIIPSGLEGLEGAQGILPFKLGHAYSILYLLKMTNKEIAKQFQYLAEIMELHEDNPFKIKTYLNTYLTIRKLPDALAEMTPESIGQIKGIGSSTSASIKELLETGTMQALKKFEDITPPGVREMLHIPGFGPKKIRVIWKELGVETIGELRYACNENRLVELKGFGEKTQEDLRQKLEYFQKSQGKFLFAEIEAVATALLDQVSKALPTAKTSLTGAIRRRSNIVERVEILVGSDETVSQIFDNESLVKISEREGVYFAKTEDEVPVTIYHCPIQEFGSKLFRYTAAEEFLQAFLEKTSGMDFKGLDTEAAVFERAALPYLEPEMREMAWSLEKDTGKLVEASDIRGVVHAHSTWSDGLHSLRQMAEHARSLGYTYLGITDHSKSAFYANGLKEDRVLAQWQEIEALNMELAPFRIFKGIESDILNDGSLDYADEILAGFDLIIASVHSNLRMDEEKATQRLIKAIENKRTTILGHPTGRLLLSRQGYPIDHRKVIDACAANGVAVELNANPHRLDLDWTWIPYALEKNLLISINPDAHSTGGIKDIKYGVISARKGGLTSKYCLTCLELADFEHFIAKKK